MTLKMEDYETQDAVLYLLCMFKSNVLNTIFLLLCISALVAVIEKGQSSLPISNKVHSDVLLEPQDVVCKTILQLENTNVCLTRTLNL